MTLIANSDHTATSRPGARRAGSALATGAWGVLLGLSILGVLNHVSGVATFAANADERMMFTLFAALDLYAVVVLLTAYRRRERWAWAVTWIHTAAYALAFVFIGPGIGSLYLIIAGVSALAQLAALPTFRRESLTDKN